jgi:predicted LPLAT superfamily acyltransferase/glycosyltransferase involved in cell wall biosynthesis
MSAPHRTCFVVPCYNHGEDAVRTVRRLLGHGLAVYLVDDGSSAGEAAHLAALASAEPIVHLIVLPANSGKGAAVTAGLRSARAAGFTHALQVDADGQHDLSVVPAFLEASVAHPKSVVCGQPVYDDSMPSLRRVARHLTHIWVWFETLSFEIRDSMCGFRVYPLIETMQVIVGARIPPRMSFDIEVLVRLNWAGVPSVWLPVPVTYPQEGRSHFRPLLDNLLITWSHTRLVVSMPWNIPLRAARRRRRSSAHWSKVTERGSGVGLGFSAWAMRVFGRPVALPIAYLVATYFFLTGSVARSAALGYLRRLHRWSGGSTPRPDNWSCYRIFLAFGKAAHDKLSGWIDHALLGKIEFPGFSILSQARESGRGALIIGSHLGNLDLMRAVARRYGLRGFHAVVYHAHSAKFTQTVADAAPESQEDLIHVQDFGPATAMRLREIIDRGECVVIVGDRTPAAENGRCVTASFLGEPADFPIGPYVLAAALECPVFLLFCFSEGRGYRVEVEAFANRVSLPRASRQAELQSLAARFAGRLEHYCRLYPLQWFNFFDFWRKAPSPSQR